MESNVVERRMAELHRRCTVARIPVTTQRRAVMEVLAPRADHPTVEQIHSAVCERLPGVSKATVYRNLEVLVELGLVDQVEHPGSAARFDPNVEPHHHFLCESCGRMVDLPLDRVVGGARLAFVETGDGLRARHLGVTVRGTCAPCRER